MPNDSAAKRERKSTDTATCVECRKPFNYTVTGNPEAPDPPPPTCGMLNCRARNGWTADEWSGQARLANARQRAGVPLNDLDHEAIRRTRSFQAVI